MCKPTAADDFLQGMPSLHRLENKLSRFLDSPGGPGILALAVLTPAVLGVAVLLARDRVSCHAISLGTIGLVFWLWAMHKVVATGDQDFGALTFLLVILAAASSGKGGSDNSHNAKIARASRALWRLGTAALVVCTNYVLVLVLIDVPRGFQMYLALGASWWGFAALWTCTALSSYSTQLRRNSDVDLEAEALVEAEELEYSVSSKAKVLLFQ